tara:strand:+ start:2035 stop:2484 length:450 start_codon:yes stop_codon:yes gene_type:complete
MFQLPSDVIKKIWEFDSTYRDAMNLCLLELQFISPYWGLRVLFDKKYHIKTVEKKTYDKYYSVSKNLAFYWNNNYKNVLIERGRRLNPRETKYWTYNEFVCDVYPDMYPRIFRNIKNYKYKMFNINKMCDTNKSEFYKSEMNYLKLTTA